MSNKPTHNVYVVSDAKAGKQARWTQVGAVWPHGKGEGFDLVIPEGVAVYGRIVCMPPKANDTTEE